MKRPIIHQFLISYCFAPFGGFSILYYTHKHAHTQEKCGKTAASYFFYPQLYSIIESIAGTPEGRAAKTEGQYNGE